MRRTDRCWLPFALALCLAASADAQLAMKTDANGRRVITNTNASSQSLVRAARRNGAFRETEAQMRRRLRYRALVDAAAARHSVPRGVLEAVISVESDFNPRARSSKGACGLMQLMPGTARHLGVEDVWDPAANIDGGARYMRELLDRFDQNLTLALAAYNAGPGSVERAGGVPRFPETTRYIRKVRSRLRAGSTLRSATTLRAVRVPGGTSRLTNLGPTQSSLRVLRDQRGILTLTNR